MTSRRIERDVQGDARAATLLMFIVVYGYGTIISLTTIMHLLAVQTFLTSLIAGAFAHDNGMVMNMDQGASMNMGNMLMYLHFKIGDNLWILGWAPSNGGAMAGACIALFMLAIAERWLVAMRGLMEDHWCTRFVLLAFGFARTVLLIYSVTLYSAQIALSNKLNGGASVASTSTSLEGRANPSSGDSAEPRLGWLQRHVPPFILAHEIPRGISQVAITSIQFLFMLTVM